MTVERDIELESKATSDPEAFSALYQLNYKRILNYILYNTRDLDVSMDLTAETFLKALRSLSKFDCERASFTSWLYGIASKEIAMYYRAQRRDKAIHLSYFSNPEDINGARLLTSDAEVRDAHSVLQSSEEFIEMSRVLRRLPVKYQEVLVLRFFEDMSFKEIATLLARSAPTVKTQYYRALKRMRQMMEHQRANSQVSEISIGPYHLEKEVE